MSTYAILKTDLVDWLDNQTSELSAQLDTLINNAEDRLIDEVTDDAFFTKATGTLTSGTATLAKPATERGIRYLQITNSTTQVQLERRELSFVKEFYSSTSTSSVPKYFADYDAINFLLGPTPDSNYAYEIGFVAQLDRLSASNTTNFFTDRAYNLLLYACLVEGSVYVKYPEAATMYAQYYERALQGLNKRYARQQVTNDIVPAV
tara:strand:+ start:1322 stop:1939 length:618 start_codon:yes stop_codon:yes gene_type:complete